MEDGDKVEGSKRTDVIVGNSTGTGLAIGEKGDDFIINNGGTLDTRGKIGADTFVLSTEGRTCIRDFRPEEGDVLVIPEGSDYEFGSRRKNPNRLVLRIDGKVAATFNGGSDDFLDEANIVGTDTI